MRTIDVALRRNPYTISIEGGLSKRTGSFVKKLNAGNFCLVLTDTRIYGLYKERIHTGLKTIPHTIVVLPEGEKIKSKTWLFTILQELHKQDTLKKTPVILCYGGGVIGDLGGFAASIYKRGIPCVQIPTTLLAQIDASIGGKTAIDFMSIKNLIGSFYQPKAVLIDPQLLKTLASRHLRQGIAEAIKYGVIRNAKLFTYLVHNAQRIKAYDIACLSHVIYECARIKADIVAKDETEKKGIRTVLNFGHTIAHAIEGSLEFQRLSHGEAVALGMKTAAYLSYYLGLCRIQDVKQLDEASSLYELPCTVSFNTQKLLRTLIYDKKFIHGTTRMVLLERIGKTKIVENIPVALIKKALSHIKRQKR